MSGSFPGIRCFGIWHPNGFAGNEDIWCGAEEFDSGEFGCLSLLSLLLPLSLLSLLSLKKQKKKWRKKVKSKRCNQKGNVHLNSYLAYDILA